MEKRRYLWVALVISALLTGCASMQSHNETVKQVQAAGQQGNFGAALAQLDERHKSPEAKKELLYNMERGELLRLAGDLDQSTDAFIAADVRVQEWEQAARTDPQKLMGNVGAALVSERLKVYEGQDYEKVWLTTRIALNRIALGKLDDARVDIKRTHEREAVIAEFRTKETQSAVEEARTRGVEAKGREINGYPVEYLDDPEVLNLQNGYQNALSHYLAGFVYEALNEPGLAAPGYRKAVELRPGAKALEEGLRGLDERTGFTWKRKQRKTDVLFVVESGVAPARVPKGFTLPVPVPGGLTTVSISYPVIEPTSDPLLQNLQVGEQSLPLSSVVDLNVMARRALRDEMPGMVLRGFTRAIAKGVVQDQLQRQAGLLGSLLGAMASAATEQADDRVWRMLPGRVYLARAHLPPGEHDITIDGVGMGKVRVDGQYAVVPLRLYESRPLLGAVGHFGQLPAVDAVPTPEPRVVPAALPAKPPRVRPAARKPRPVPAAKAVNPKPAATAL
jgi:hypothetical protein